MTTLRALLDPQTLLNDRRLTVLAAAIALVVISIILGILHLFGVISIPFAAIGGALIPMAVTLIAFAALVILTVTLRGEMDTRRRELDQAAAAAEKDAIQRQGELVNAIRLRLSADAGDSEEERRELAAELVTAAERYHTVLRGYIRARPEIARIERDAIASYLAEAEAETRRLRADGSAAFEDIPIVSPFAVPDAPPHKAASPDEDAAPPANSIADVLAEKAEEGRTRP